MSRNKRRDIDENKFFGFAKSYLSEAFPNPQRIGCPPEGELIRMAEHPSEQDEEISDHLTGCSPCFNRYMQILAKLRTEPI